MCWFKALFQHCSKRQQQQHYCRHQSKSNSSSKTFSSSTMSSARSRRPPRYFTNPYFSDASEGATRVDENWLRQEAYKLVKAIVGRRPSEDDYHGGAYTGIAGDGYSVFRAASLFPDKSKELISTALRMIDDQRLREHSRSASKESQFLMGPLSVSVIRAICLKEGQNVDDTEIVPHINALVDTVLKSGYQRDGDDEMLVGRAGFLAAILNLRMVLKQPIISEDRLKAILNKVIESGRAYSKRHNSASPLMYQYYGTEYLGAAHGLMGILQMLLSYPKLLDANAVRDVEGSLDWLLSIQNRNGNFAPSADEIGYDRGEDELVHWCHGATGAVQLMIVAYLFFKKDKFLHAAKKSMDLIWQKGVLHKGPGICHGVAGNGYAFLSYYRLTHEQKYLERARCFAAIFCDDSFKARARTPDSPYSLFEGIGGSLCFLRDLCDPDQAQFPLVPIPFESYS